MNVQLTQPPAYGDEVFRSPEAITAWKVTHVEDMTGMVTLENNHDGMVARPAAVHWSGLYRAAPPAFRELMIQHPPAPGPMWTNGTAAAPVFTCPPWCTRHEHGQGTHEAHGLDLLELSVLDDALTTEVPLKVELVQALEDGAMGYVHMSIGHQLYQPTCVVLSRSDSARIAAALISGRAMLDATP